MAVDYYLLLVGILLLLAVLDLVVGVSNDAVNFLNSAIGSRVAGRRMILIIASLGILLGATFSGGMMEVARTGIFNPSAFVFSDIMIIFLAVMLTDIMLLDVFNALGLPTSTTVSIVFELLGAAVAVALLQLWRQGGDFAALPDYIHSASALTIIAGIFLSVSIAFVVGMALQWVSRLLFTFHYEHRLRWLGGIWSGLALTAITWFLFIKGLKGASFLSGELQAWVARHTLVILPVLLITLSAFMQVLQSVFKVAILRIVVLCGTFALAMAFASNDLVNFIGVPLAGLEATRVWWSSGVAAESLGMEALARPVRADTLLLLLAGLVMTLTLWFSKKARTVTETEVNLARQSDGLERFEPNGLARGLVRGGRWFGSLLRYLLPLRLREKTEESFQPIHQLQAAAAHPAPAFDLVRASVNLTGAAMLIALATSYKLPLSTTYVSFMVAMGSSLADRAWGRGSAVFRVAGVLQVIGGWFLTAVVAFSTAALFAVILYAGGGLAVLGLLVLALSSVFFSKRWHNRKREARHATVERQVHDQATMGHHLARVLTQSGAVYAAVLRGVLQEDRALLRLQAKELGRLDAHRVELQRQLYLLLRHSPAGQEDHSRSLLLAYDLEQDWLQSLRLIVTEGRRYVGNSLPPMQSAQGRDLRALQEAVPAYLEEIALLLSREHAFDRERRAGEKARLHGRIAEALENQLDTVRRGSSGFRNSQFMLSLLLETKDLIAIADRLGRLGAGQGGTWAKVADPPILARPDYVE